MSTPYHFPAEIAALAEAVLDRCRTRGWHVATAESCTGGLIAGALTAIAGSSDVVEGGFVTYSNAMKTQVLGVAPPLLADHGAVSQPVAAAMAKGVLAALPQVDLAVSVTGIAGPGGGTPGKPVGLVWFGLVRRGAPTKTLSRIFPGDRDAIRLATVAQALELCYAASQS